MKPASRIHSYDYKAWDEFDVVSSPVNMRLYIHSLLAYYNLRQEFLEGEALIKMHRLSKIFLLSETCLCNYYRRKLVRMWTIRLGAHLGVR